MDAAAIAVDAPATRAGPDSEPGRRGRLSGALLLLSLIAIVVFTASRPGDAQFANDEPLTVGRALDAMDRGILVDDGPIGLIGTEYGPVTTQFMQLMLWITGRDLHATMALRAAVYMSATAGAMWWLSRLLRLNAWFIPVALVAPPIWYHARLLWDNPWLLPLGLGMLAGYAGLLKGDRWWCPATLGFCGTLAVLTHPMSAAMPLGIALHALLGNGRRHVRRAAAAIALGAMVSVSTSVPYLQRNFGYQVTRLAVWLGSKPITPPPPARDRLPDVIPPNLDRLPSRPVAAVAAWQGPRLLSSEHDIADINGASAAGSVLAWLKWPALFGTVLLLVGAAIALAGGSAVEPLWQSLGRACLLVTALQTIIFAAVRPTLLLHYQFGASAATILICWLAADAFMRRRAGSMALACYGLSLAAATVVVAQCLHASQGTRSDYGPSLNELTRTARAAAEAGCGSIWTDIRQLQRFPQGLVVPLSQCDLRMADATEGLIGVVRFRSTDPADARLTFTPATQPPGGAFECIWSRDGKTSAAAK